MDSNKPTTSSSSDFKNLLSGSVYIITLGLVLAFIIASLSEFFTKF